MSAQKDLVEKMSEKQQCSSVAFHTFTLSYRKPNYKNTAFCFVEGEDDKCYYRLRVENTLSMDAFFIECGNKQNVIETYNLVRASKKTKTKTLFFVDRDYDLEKIPNGIYVTDFYSIENFYLTKEVILNILKKIMNLSSNYHNLKHAKKLFQKCYKQYSTSAKVLNTFYYTIRAYEYNNSRRKTDLNQHKFNHFIESKEIKLFTMKKITYTDLISEYKITYNIPLTEFQKNSKFFSLNSHKNFRGKFELSFLKLFLSSVQESVKKGKNGFVEQTTCSYNFNNDTMLMLSGYAYTPPSLVEYIRTAN